MAKRGRPRKNARYCLCGCGTEVTKKARFAVGHDGKVTHMLAMVNKGQSQFGSLPEILKEHLVTCEKCKNYMLPKKNQNGPYICHLCTKREANLKNAEIM